MTKKFKYLPHTAEIKFLAYGKNFRIAIENAAAAMLNVMLDVQKIKKMRGRIKSIEIKEKAETKEDLVWYVLQDMLSKIDEKALAAYKFKINEICAAGKAQRQMELKGRLFYKELKGVFTLLDVKGVTSNELKVKEGKTKSITVVLDV